MTLRALGYLFDEIAASLDLAIRNSRWSLLRAAGQERRSAANKKQKTESRKQNGSHGRPFLANRSGEAIRGGVARISAQVNTSTLH
jgi:hypothetical protein